MVYGLLSTFILSFLCMFVNMILIIQGSWIREITHVDMTFRSTLTKGRSQNSSVASRVFLQRMTNVGW